MTNLTCFVILIYTIHKQGLCTLRTLFFSVHVICDKIIIFASKIFFLRTITFVTQIIVIIKIYFLYWKKLLYIKQMSFCAQKKRNWRSPQYNLLLLLLLYSRAVVLNPDWNYKIAQKFTNVSWRAFPNVCTDKVLIVQLYAS